MSYMTRFAEQAAEDGAIDAEVLVEANSRLYQRDATDKLRDLIQEFSDSGDRYRRRLGEILSEAVKEENGEQFWEALRKETGGFHEALSNFNIRWTFIVGE
jgi:hypothetical protein